MMRPRDSLIRQLGQVAHPKTNLRMARNCLMAARSHLELYVKGRLMFDVTGLDREEIDILCAGFGEYSLVREGTKIYAKFLKGD